MGVSKLRTTHAYALLEVSSLTYAEIRDKLQAAGYPLDDPDVIDMHGIALRPEPPEPEPTWGWYCGEGREPERYCGTYETREQAILTAKDKGWTYFTICEGKKGKLSDDIFTAWRVLDDFEDHNCEQGGEDGVQLDVVTNDQQHELETMLATTLATWRRKHDIGVAWAFEETRNEELIDLTAQLPT